MYQRKTKDEFQIQVNYGYGDGWEYEISEDSRKEGMQRLKEYRENCNYPSRLVTKRVKIEGKSKDSPVSSPGKQTKERDDYATTLLRLR